MNIINRRNYILFGVNFYRNYHKMRANDGRLWGKFNNDEFEVRSLTKSGLEEALEILDKSFFLNEPICIACEIHLPENAQARSELRELCRATADDGVSLVANHVQSGKIVGVLFNKLQYIPPNGEDPFFIQFRKECTKSPQAQCLMDFMNHVDSETDVFELYKIDTLLELMFVATLPEWGRRGIGSQLIRYAIQLARELSEGIGVDEIHPQLRDKRPKAVTAIFTSIFSQKFGNSQNFKVINRVPYTDYAYNGKTFDQSINPLHKTSEHCAMLL
uniref:Urease accessory protein UreF n=2 Tax=Zeugodacus cucurbitae TaxID=28588 RepID=A0A0A1WG81_ZEUCU